MRVVPGVRPCLRVALALAAALSASPARGEVAEVALRSGVFLEPSPTSRMRVLTPGATVSARPVELIGVHASYQADVVSGASEPVKAGRTFAATPDIVTAASVEDLRQVVGGGVRLYHGRQELGVSYAQGDEQDYRSRTITAEAAAEFAERSARLELAVSHGEDRVCDLAQNRLQAPTLRLRLDASDGCFTADDRRALPVTTDNFQGALTQSITPRLHAQLVLTGAVQHGFLANPYRSVVIGPNGEAAQEHHPGDRLRAAAALRLRYFVKPLDAAVGLGGRGYWDSWGIVSQTVELDAEKSLGPVLRVGVRGRYYRQGEAIFWSDDYTGGEPLDGPRGQYWSGDRELSPLSSLLVGGRLTAALRGRRLERLGGIFESLDLTVAGSALSTTLREFTWAGRDPDDTLAVIGSLGIAATF